MRILSKSKLGYSLTLGFLIGLGVGAMSAWGTETGWLPGILAFAVFLFFALRKSLRRWRATRESLDPDAAEWLEENVRLYARLDPEVRRQFESDIRIILDEWIFEGIGEVEVSGEMRLGVAAGAALLLLGRPEWELPYRQTVLFYPSHFDDDYLMDGEGEYDGMAHQQGPIILSAAALEESWKDGEDGANVVLHELAHLLDYKTEFADGVPSLVDARSLVAWQALMQKEIDRILQRRSILDSYGATDPAEFFAVAVETFFERPQVLKARHGELFAALAALFNLDPRTGSPPETG